MDKRKDITNWSGAYLEDEIKKVAVMTKPENFERACNYIQVLLDEQNSRARKIANKHKRLFVNRTVSDVFKYYWLANQIERSKDEN